MYCIKCGVKLSDSEKSCPLCGTVPYHPEIPANSGAGIYPKWLVPKQTMNRYAVMVLVTVLYVVLVGLLITANLLISGNFTWAYYAAGGLALSYIFVVLPLWFRKPNPVIFVPCDFAAVGLYLLGVDMLTKGEWFLSFGFPVVGIAALFVTALVALVYYVRRGYFFIFGGFLIACGVYAGLIELFIYITFGLSKYQLWSIYPLVACVLFGLALIVIGICPTFRKKLEKKFFI